MYVGVLDVRSEDSQVTAEAIDRENTIVMPLLQMLGFTPATCTYILELINCAG